MHRLLVLATSVAVVLVGALCIPVHPRCTLGRGVLRAEDEHEGAVDGT